MLSSTTPSELTDLQSEIAEFHSLLREVKEVRALRRLRQKQLDLKCELAALTVKDVFARYFEQCRKAGFNPSQPRVPAGNSDGGQWTSEGGGGERINDSRVISDATPDNEWQLGAQYAANRPRTGPIIINGRPVQPTPAQAARLAVAEARARNTINRVREVDPNWRPRPSTYETVEGMIRTHQADARQAEARLDELARVGIGPGPYATESIPARGPERDFNAAERHWGNGIGRCHTCGERDPGTLSGNYVLDHQWPNALNPPGMAQRLYPQCATCSRLQAGWVRRLQLRRD